MSNSEKTTGADIDVLDALLRTAHYLKREFESRLSSMDIPAFLTGPRLHLLVTVADLGPIRMSDLAARMGIKAITVTQFVDALEKERMLERAADPNDRRATLVRLTDQAPPLIEQARAAAKVVKDGLVEPLPPEARSQLLGLLSQLVDYKNECIFDSKGR
jgi:DNA-binding MarR family transcriptional regulator